MIYLMKKIALLNENPALQNEAEQLALQLQIPLIITSDNSFDYLLVLTSDHLELRALHYHFKPLYIDFLSNVKKYRLKQGGRGELIAKAVGIKAKYLPTIIDCTAGLGNDAFVLASIGCKVQMLERTPLLAMLIADGIKRARISPEFANYSLSLIHTDAKEYLTKLTPEQYPDVIYLDPMFPVRQKTALVKKEMRILQDIAGKDLDAPVLLELAFHCAKKRVVMKRPRLAESITQQKPDIILSGKSVRFDVYLTSV